MPRARNWKDITLYRPYKDAKYEHIDELLSDTIDWNLIETHFPDMLRVALSIKAGKITASTLLRKLSTYSRKNRWHIRIFACVYHKTFGPLAVGTLDAYKVLKVFLV